MKKLFLTIGFARGHCDARPPSPKWSHTADSMPQKDRGKITVSSLRNAQKLGVYGVEFDVNMTADDSLIVYHGRRFSTRNFMRRRTASPKSAQ